MAKPPNHTVWALKAQECVTSVKPPLASKKEVCVFNFQKAEKKPRKISQCGRQSCRDTVQVLHFS